MEFPLPMQCIAALLFEARWLPRGCGTVNGVQFDKFERLRPSWFKVLFLHVKHHPDRDIHCLGYLLDGDPAILKPLDIIPGVNLKRNAEWFFCHSLAGNGDSRPMNNAPSE